MFHIIDIFDKKVKTLLEYKTDIKQSRGEKPELYHDGKKSTNIGDCGCKKGDEGQK